MGSKTDFLENELNDHVLRGETYTAPTAVYSGLFTVLPSDSTGGTEVTQASSGYTRLATTFVTSGATTPGRSVSETAKTFATVAGGATITVVGYGILDAATSGNLLYWATVTETVLNVGDAATFGAGAIVVTED